MAGREFEQFLQVLYTFDHRRGMALFDGLAGTEENFWPVADALLLVCANHQDPKLTVPHGLQTVQAAREMFTVAGPEASWGLLRFITLYSFSLVKRDWTATYLQTQGEAAEGDPAGGLWRAISGGNPDRAAGYACAVALRSGVDAAGHALIRASLSDPGRLSHNLTLAVAYAEAARSLGMPGALVPIANGAHFLATTLRGASAFEPEPFEESLGEATVDALQAALEEGDYDSAHRIFRAFAASDQPERAFEPLLIGVSKDPGFLGHNLLLAHALRGSANYLTKEELSHVLWKYYRTLGRAFEYPEELAVKPRPGLDAQGAISGLKSTLRHRTPPPLVTLSDCFSAGVPLDGILKQIVGGYTGWQVGEKEHTILYLNAAVQTANFLGEDKALLPLVVALQKLPF